jgi:predicted regulator of Ras-like GTPase activity (Roadblock/LC7/MglB family)
MSKDRYAAALKTTLTEIQNICPDIKSSFIFTKEGVIVAGDSDDSDVTVKKALNSFQSIIQKADSIGGVEEFSVNGAEGTIEISQVSDMYLATTTSTDVDTKYLRTITRVIVPTVLKLLRTIVEAPAPLPFKATSPQQLTVEKITGFFVGDSAQVDQKILREWTKSFKGRTITTVEIQTLDGEATRCKVKAMDDKAMEGKGLIRIPDKILKTLDVKEGALVRVKPTKP